MLWEYTDWGGCGDQARLEFVEHCLSIEDHRIEKGEGRISLPLSCNVDSRCCCCQAGCHVSMVDSCFPSLYPGLLVARNVGLRFFVILLRERGWLSVAQVVIGFVACSWAGVES